jgi:hypothetical protein
MPAEGGEDGLLALREDLGCRAAEAAEGVALM